MLAEAEGGVEAFRAIAAPAIRKLIDGARIPDRAPALMAGRTEIRFGRKTIWNDAVLVVLRRPDGSFAGATTIVKPAIGAAALAMLALGDERLFERMLNLIQPKQLPGAIMFGDLEGSTPSSPAGCRAPPTSRSCGGSASPPTRSWSMRGGSSASMSATG